MKSSGGRVEAIDDKNVSVSDLICQRNLHPGEINILQEKLINRLLDEKILIQHLSDCAEHITIFKNDSEGYVLGLIQCVDVCSSDELWGVYKSFVYQLVTAHPTYTQQVLKYHINNFKTINGAEDNDEMSMVTEHVHSLITNILQIVPMCAEQVLRIISAGYPFQTLDVAIHLSYLHNVLTLATQHTQLRYNLTKLCINKLMKLDLLSPRHEVLAEEEKREEEEREEENQFPEKPEESCMDLEESCMELEASSMDGSVEESCSMAHETADKLDILLDVVFDHVYAWMSVDGEIDPHQATTTYVMFREIFDEEIVCVRSSAHLPFLMFYIIAQHKPLVYDFLEYLWERILNPFTPQSVRELAAHYIASLVSKAQFFKMKLLMKTIFSMVEWIDSYMKKYTDTSSKSTAPQLSRHLAFYSVCQSVFYIIAYRSKQLTRSPERLGQLASLNLERIIGSRLNPLAVTDDNILRNFAAITRHHQILYCDTVIEHNTRCNYDNDKLQAYFPFDKYILKRSAHWIEGLLKDYDGLKVEAESADLNQESGEDDFLDEDVETTGAADEVLRRHRKLSFTDSFTDHMFNV